MTKIMGSNYMIKVMSFNNALEKHFELLQKYGNVTNEFITLRIVQFNNEEHKYAHCMAHINGSSLIELKNKIDDIIKIGNLDATKSEWHSFDNSENMELDLYYKIEDECLDELKKLEAIWETDKKQRLLQHQDRMIAQHIDYLKNKGYKVIDPEGTNV